MYEEKQSNRIIISSGIGRLPSDQSRFIRDLSSLGFLGVPPRIDKQNTRCVNNLPPRVIFPRSQTSIPASKFSSPDCQTFRRGIWPRRNATKPASNGMQMTRNIEIDILLSLFVFIDSRSGGNGTEETVITRLFFIRWTKTHFLLK